MLFRAISVLTLITAANLGCSNHDGCVSDVECKGDRICEDGKCVSPTTAGAGGSGSSTSGTMSSGAGGASPSCAPGAGCMVADKSCLGLTDNAGKTKFGLRMSQFIMKKPTALAALSESAIAGTVPLSLP